MKIVIDSEVERLTNEINNLKEESMLNVDEVKLYCNTLRKTCNLPDGVFGIAEEGRIVNAFEQDMSDRLH